MEQETRRWKSRIMKIKKVEKKGVGGEGGKCRWAIEFKLLPGIIFVEIIYLYNQGVLSAVIIHFKNTCISSLILTCKCFLSVIMSVRTIL